MTSATGIADAQELAPGMWRLPVALPGHSVGHVNTYALVSADGILLIDTGWDTDDPPIGAFLRRVGAEPHHVERVLTTHCHVDHCGLGRRLQERFGARLAMHDEDASLLASRYFEVATTAEDAAYVKATIAWARAAGVPEDGQRFAVQQVMTSAGRISPFVPDDALVDGERLTFGPWELVVLHTPGHTPGHCCFYETTTGVLFTGDHIFPHIMASPTYRPQSPANPIDAYIESLDRLADLDVRLVAPGHEGPFGGLPQRLDALRAYHARRMAGLTRALSGVELTLDEVCAQLSRSRPWGRRPWRSRLASLGESYAHLLSLERQGLVARIDDAPIRWRTQSAPDASLTASAT